MSDTAKGTLYCIPSLLGGHDAAYIPDVVKTTVANLSHFIVEYPKSARQFLRQIGFQRHFDEVWMEVLDKRTEVAEWMSLLQPALEGHDVGIISEAGAPGIADPGAQVVSLAHQLGIRVVPLPGPSSILLALMASGLNGQSFAFHGYLPIDKKERARELRRLEQQAAGGQTQLFMEAPYRNNQLIADILQQCHPDTLLLIAANLTLPNALIRTQTIGKWKGHVPDLHKQPAIFGLGK